MVGFFHRLSRCFTRGAKGDSGGGGRSFVGKFYTPRFAFLHVCKNVTRKRGFPGLYSGEKPPEIRSLSLTLHKYLHAVLHFFVQRT